MVFDDWLEISEVLDKQPHEEIFIGYSVVAVLVAKRVLEVSVTNPRLRGILVLFNMILTFQNRDSVWGVGVPGIPITFDNGSSTIL